MCGGMKYMDLSKVFTNDELTILINSIVKEQDNEIHYLKVNRMTEGDRKLSESIDSLEKILKKLESLRSGYEYKM